MIDRGLFNNIDEISATMKAMIRIASHSFIGDRKDTAILSEKECLCFLYFDPTAGLMDMRNGFIETIGNTPLICLQAASDLTGSEILGKAEFKNPGGLETRSGPYRGDDALRQRR